MSRPKNKDEYRKELAEAFAGVLEEKGLEWKKEWQGTGGSAPQNGITKACYRGCNAFSLSLTSMLRGYNDPRWVTMVQIMDREGKYHPGEHWHLKKGSKATYVEYWFPYDIKAKKAVSWEKFRVEVESGRSEKEFRLSTRYTAVFNACDVEGITDFNEPEHRDLNADSLVKMLSETMGVPIHTDGGDRAYYSKANDSIHLPTPESFESQYAFNATALHELSHSTGHPSRLHRDMSGMFGSSQYAYEELVAEMSSCFMGVCLDTQAMPEHIENHKAYVQSWIQEIRDKSETLVKAIKDAQQAAGYMDMKAGLITKAEFEKVWNSAVEVKVKGEKEMER